MLSKINKLIVKYHNHKVGELAMTPDGVRCVFEYDKKWLSEGFSISPRELPLSTEMFIAKQEPFYGNFGVFEDSLPDGYGRYLLNRMLRRKGVNDFNLNPLQRLSIIGNAGMGALCYEPEILQGEIKQLPQLEELQQMTLDLFGEQIDVDEELLYYSSGNSGGCRPKCLFQDTEGNWIVKFRHTYDPINMGVMEWKYNNMARECDIEVPDFKLIDNKFFATKRFDLVDGVRKHVVTAAAMLGVSHQLPSLDYSTLLNLTGWLTQDPSAVEQMYRRMVFNVLAKNRDDHAKNFSFIYNENRWYLSPAYDLTYSPAGYNGEHSTMVNGSGKPTINDMITVGTAIRITKKRCIDIINEVKYVIEKYQN